MEPMTLEKTLLINTAIALWMRHEIKEFMIKLPNGLIKLDKAIPLLKQTVLDLPLNQHLKKKLIYLVERIGFELYIFLTKGIINCEEFDARNIKWTKDGLVEETETLNSYFAKISHYSVSDFKSSCLIFEETLIRRVWNNLTESEKNTSRKNFRKHLFQSYWIYNIEDNLDNFTQDFAYLIIGFEGERSLNANMLWHSITVNNKKAISYFYTKMISNNFGIYEIDLKIIIDDVLLFALKTFRPESFKFISSFFERPIINQNFLQFIINKMNCECVKNFLDYILRQINIFGDIHFNIFNFVLFKARHKCIRIVHENLDFYALNLLSKGKLEKFDYLRDMDSKKILHRRISYRLKHGYGLAIFSTIHMNNHTKLLRNFLDWLAENDDDREFFCASLSAIMEGTQYDMCI